MELGLYSFVELTDPKVSPAQRMRDLIEEIKLADELGLDVYGVGEHHRPDFLSSSPAVVLGGAATVTKNIRLSSAVNVISSDDPVRVFQRFAMVDLLSDGRAEIMAGRGSFIESFPLFGYDLADYEELFEEKLDMLLQIRKGEHLTWSGKHRPPVDGRGVYPRPVQDPLPVWIAVGGNPESVVRAAKRGLPMALAIIGGEPARFAPLVELHREAARRSGHVDVPVSINSHGFIADGSKEALDESFPAVAEVMNRIGKERGWPPMSRGQYNAAAELEGANFVGSPDQVTEKILHQYSNFNHERFLLQLSVGTLPHLKVMHAIELYGTKVAPAVRAEIGSWQPHEGVSKDADPVT